MINRRYKILERTGIGRSEIYLCRDKENQNQKCVLKILPSSADIKEANSFREEFLTLSRLKHKNIVKVFSYDSIIEIDNVKLSDSIGIGSKFFVMEYLEGKTLNQIESSLPEDKVIEIIKQIALVLNYLHSFNIIYHDLKLENIILIDSEENFEIKLIDFGLVQSFNDKDPSLRKGTIEYMAPELLGTEDYDYRIDLYALGVIIYWLIYHRFPFEGDSHLSILNAHLEKEPEFPETEFSRQIIGITKKLLSKNKNDRYICAIDLLVDLHINFNQFFNDFSIPKVFVSNSIAYSIVQDQMKRQRDERTLVISGGEGSGKTTLVEEVFYHFKNVILIRKSDFKKSKNFWEIILSKIIYTQFIFHNLERGLLKQIINFRNKPAASLKDELKTILSNICQKNKFVLIIDDFNLLDPTVIEFFLEIAPILTINEIVLILTENSNYPSKTSALKQKIERVLQPFTHDQVSSYINRTFSEKFERDKLIDMVENYTDCVPGNIDLLLNNLIFLKAFRLQKEKIIIDISDDSKILLDQQIHDINKLKLNNISNDAKKIAHIISLFEVNISVSDLSYLTGEEEIEIIKVLYELEKNNIIRVNNQRELSFTSNSLKEYVLSSYEDLTLIKEIAEKLFDSDSHNVANNEISRLFEKVGDFSKSFETLYKEYKLAESLKTYGYQLEILEHIISLPLDSMIIIQNKFNLIDINIILGNFNRAIELLSEIESLPLNDSEKQRCSIYRARALMGTADYRQAKNIYASLEKTDQNLISENTIKYEIASAELYLHEPNSAQKICNKILDSPHTDSNLKAKTFNLLGMIKYETNALDEAIMYFKESLNIYNNERDNFNAAKAEKNVGNIYYLKGDRTKAKYHWDRARQKNKLVGSLDEEAFILLNYGNYYFHSLDLESAIENYSQSLTILSNLGRHSGREIVLANLAEAYLLACEYDKSLKILNEAEQMLSGPGSDISELRRVYFLYGLVHYNLSSERMLKNAIKFLENQTNSGSDDIDLFLLIEYLNSLLRNLSGYQPDFVVLSKNLQICLDEKNDELLKKYTFLYAETAIENNNLNKAYEVLNHGLFNDLILDNPYEEAYKKYLLGKISKLSNGQTFKPHIDYFEAAYSYVSDCSITELTWKITFALAESFAERGILTKAQNYINLTKSLLDHLALNIKNIENRSNYLENRERRKVIKMLENWSTIIK